MRRTAVTGRNALGFRFGPRLYGLAGRNLVPQVIDSLLNEESWEWLLSRDAAWPGGLPPGAPIAPSELFLQAGWPARPRLIGGPRIDTSALRCSLYGALCPAQPVPGSLRHILGQCLSNLGLGTCLCPQLAESFASDVLGLSCADVTAFRPLLMIAAGEQYR